MSMYNMIFGENAAADFLLALLDLTREDVGRFRDCFVAEEGKQIVVYTRNGGGNRDCWHQDDPKWGNKSCGGESYEVEVDEIVTVTEEEAKAKGYRLLNIFVGNKRKAKTGNRVKETGYTCAEPQSSSCSCPGCVIQYRLREHPQYITDRDDDFDCTYATIYFRTPERARPLVKDLVEQRDPNALWLKTIEELEKGKRPEIVEKLRPLVERLVKELSPAEEWK